MSCVTAVGPNTSLPIEAIIIDAARCWREAVDRRIPVLPTLFARLEMREAGFLAPAIAALLALHEAWSGRRFVAGEPAGKSLTDDERSLLDLLEAATPPATSIPSKPTLTAPLTISLRSTRLLIKRVLGRDFLGRGAFPESAPEKPMFFRCANDTGEAGAQRTNETQDAA